MTRIACVLVVVAAIMPARSEAQAGELADPREPPPTRIVGIGTVLAGIGGESTSYFRPGLPSHTVGSGTGAGPSIDVLAFFDDHAALGLSIPLLPLVAQWAQGAPAWSTRLHLEWSFGDWVRFLVGPGARVDYSSRGDDGLDLPQSSTQVSLLALLGMEILTPSRLLGIRLTAWPSIGFAHQDFRNHAEMGSQDLLSVGATVELSLVWYVTNDR